MLCGKTAFITGSNRGIGKAIVTKFAQHGANIIAHARARTDEFEKLIADISVQHGVAIHPVYFDMTDYDAMRQVVRGVIKDKTPVHVLVNNAGVVHGGFFQMTPIAKIREIFEVNFFAQLELTQMLLRYMGKCGCGSIINIASLAGIDILKGDCAYGTSKAALIAFTKALGAEFGETNVRINAVAPGLTDTDMGCHIKERTRKYISQKCAANRLARAEEIANATAFLASDEASFVNGHVLRIDGGGVLYEREPTV